MISSTDKKIEVLKLEKEQDLLAIPEYIDKDRALIVHTQPNIVGVKASRKFLEIIREYCYSKKIKIEYVDNHILLIDPNIKVTN